MVVKNTLAYYGKEILTAVKILSTTAQCYKKIYVRNLQIFVFVPDKPFQPSQMFGGVGPRANPRGELNYGTPIG
jgi:hypothetical protein